MLTKRSNLASGCDFIYFAAQVALKLNEATFYIKLYCAA